MGCYCSLPNLEDLPQDLSTHGTKFGSTNNNIGELPSLYLTGSGPALDWGLEATRAEKLMLGASVVLCL